MHLDSRVIKKAVEYIGAKEKQKETNNKVKQEETNNKEKQKETNKLKELIDEFKNNYNKHKNECNFSKTKSIFLKQKQEKNKKRLVKQYEKKFSSENILCQCIKQILDREFKIKYPNRNKIVKSLFNVIHSIKNLSDFTIIKFDFENYFNSLSSIYVYEKIIKSNLRNRIEEDLIEKFVYETKYAFAGLQTSNVIAEIIGRLFDDEIVKFFSSNGLIFYERYIDDGIIILNENLNKDKAEKELSSIVEKVFYDKTIYSDLKKFKKCKTKINDKKFKFLTKRNINNIEESISFLGYEFYFKNESTGRLSVRYGITEEKRDKYKKRIEELIKLYIKDNSSKKEKLKLLRHRILAFCCRTVYVNKKFNTLVWKVKGFISNYGELRGFLMNNHEKIHEDTLNFLKEGIRKSFVELLGESEVPYFIKGTNEENSYSLYKSMLKNKTLLFEQHIGYNTEDLRKLCENINIPSTDGSGNKGYYKLVREYLIKVKVGF